MDKCIFDESNGLWYELQGDYYIPCLTLPPEKEKPIGLLYALSQRCKNKPQLFLPKFPCLAYKQNFRYNKAKIKAKIKARRFHHGQQPVRRADRQI